MQRRVLMDLDDGYYKKILDNLYDGIYFIDRDKKIIYWNKGAEKHTGYRAEDVIGKHCWDNILMHVDESGTTLCNGSCPISQSISDGRLREVDLYLHHKEGHLVPVSMRIAPLRDDDAQHIVVAVEIFSENAPKFSLHQRLQELKGLALLDAVTGIGNRRNIEMTMKGRLEELNRYGWPFGVLFIDIDNFKLVNDRYGHDIGDRVLKMVSKTVANTLRPFDSVGRWGGEEFIAVIVNVNTENLSAVAERIRLLVEKTGIAIDSETVTATVSIGAALAQQDDNESDLIKRADALMYKSKAAGKNCVSI